MCRYFTVLPTHEEHRGSFQVGEDMHNWATADPDTFAFVEVLKTPFLFPMAEVVHGA